MPLASKEAVRKGTVIVYEEKVAKKTDVFAEDCLRIMERERGKTNMPEGKFSRCCGSARVYL